MRMDAYALIAWLKASIVNGWLGTPVLNPELDRSAARDRQLDRANKHQFIQHLVVLKRLRLGYVGGGRVPHRTRGAPTPRRKAHHHPLTTDAAHRGGVSMVQTGQAAWLVPRRQRS